MKENKELERSDIVVDHDMEVDENGTITAYLESWFDVDKKFGTHTADRDDEWLNLYAEYNPADDTLKMGYQVDSDDSSTFYEYAPTAAEQQLVKEMITEKIKKEYGQTPQEFCAEIIEDESPTMGGIT